MVLIQPEWDFYFCKVEGHLASIMLDLALSKHLPLEEKPYLIQLAVAIQTPDIHGLTLSSEAEVLFIMEDRLAEHLSESLQGIYAARSTSNGKRTFYFYCSSSVGYEGVISEVMDGFSYEYSVQSTTDPGWTFYQQFLYPTPQEYQSIQNRKVVDQLIAQGDDPKIEREVAHKLYFPKLELAEECVEKLEKEGFKTGRIHEKSGSTLAEAIILRNDPVDVEHMDKLVQMLNQTVGKFGGEYQGWNTTLAINE
ncbi:MAG: DUF695 domain-containing protein [Bacteroidia bacterium]|nr:DUF695 domain-containing protein [Bacteroidia bacterium]